MEIPIPPSSIPVPPEKQNIPRPPQKDFFSSQNKINSSVMFLIISGLGGLWLTYQWNEAGEGGNYGMFPVLHYYIANSALLFLLGIFLYIKQYKVYSITSVILGISVTASLLVLPKESFNPLESLFVATTFQGIILGAVFGGFVLVPMFLIGVYKSFFRAIKNLRGQKNFNPS